MPKNYQGIAQWALSCSLQCAAGEKLVDAIESCGTFSRGKRLKVARGLRMGQGVQLAFSPFFPSLTHADIAFLAAAQKAGSLSEGFELLSDQYFIRARVQSILLAAFIYPICILFIGFFLLSLQPVLYREMALKPAIVLFAKLSGSALIGIYILKQILCLRPPALRLFLRFLPPFGGLSCGLSAQRFGWILDRSCIAGVSVRDAVNLAAAASGRSAVMRRAAYFDREVALGGKFGVSFDSLQRAWPNALRSTVVMHSPNNLPGWARGVAFQAGNVIANRVEWIVRLSKPLALMLAAPLIFLVIRQLWITMVAEVGQRTW